MTYQGIVQNSVIVLEGEACLPEEAKVQIELAEGFVTSTNTNSELTIGHKLAALARKCEDLPCDLPEDLAMNYDHYLYGLPKRTMNNPQPIGE